MIFASTSYLHRNTTVPLPWQFIWGQHRRRLHLRKGQLHGLISKKRPRRGPPSAATFAGVLSGRRGGPDLSRNGHTYVRCVSTYLPADKPHMFHKLVNYTSSRNFALSSDATKRAGGRACQPTSEMMRVETAVVFEGAKLLETLLREVVTQSNKSDTLFVCLLINGTVIVPVVHQVDSEWNNSIFKILKIALEICVSQFYYK